MRTAKPARNPRQAGFPKRCYKCGSATTKITAGKWAGTYHCRKCGIYQEWSR